MEVNAVCKILFEVQATPMIEALVKRHAKVWVKRLVNTPSTRITELEVRNKATHYLRGRRRRKLA